MNFKKIIFLFHRKQQKKIKTFKEKKNGRIIDTSKCKELNYIKLQLRPISKWK